MNPNPNQTSYPTYGAPQQAQPQPQAQAQAQPQARKLQLSAEDVDEIGAAIRHVLLEAFGTESAQEGGGRRKPRAAAKPKSSKPKAPAKKKRAACK